jgi:RNA 2',3'-cyclic 3'-phosphodiesterase
MNADQSIRTFIAIELSEEVKTGLRALQSRLKSPNAGCAKWVDPGSIHLTLKFLGSTRRDLIPSITSNLDNLAKNIFNFELSITELGAFPDFRRVRVVWVGLTGALNDLNRLQIDIESAISPLGFPTEKRPFVPHLTLARLRETATILERQNLGSLIQRTGVTHALKLNVHSFSLIKSDLMPSGAIYTILHTVNLS